MLDLMVPLSLTVSCSVCSEIFPYLVVVIGLENVLVLTKSVVSTPVDLEVKLRIAQGNTGLADCSSYICAQRDKDPSKCASKVLAAQVQGPVFNPHTWEKAQHSAVQL